MTQCRSEVARCARKKYDKGRTCRAKDATLSLSVLQPGDLKLSMLLSINYQPIFPRPFSSFSIWRLKIPQKLCCTGYAATELSIARSHEMASLFAKVESMSLLPIITCWSRKATVLVTKRAQEVHELRHLWF